LRKTDLVNVAPTVSMLPAKIATRFRRAARILIQRFGIMPMPPVCENLVAWSADRGYKTLRIHSPFVWDFPLPECVVRRPRLKALFQPVNGLGYPSQHLVVLPAATLKRNRGLIVFNKNCYLAEAHWRASNVYDDPAYRNEWPLTDRRKLAGDWYCLMGHWGNNYNHWIWDELPRLFSAMPHLPEHVRFIVSDDLSNFQRDTLQALDITPNRCLTQSAFGETQVERLWFATPLGHGDHATTAPDVAKRMRNVFVGRFGSQTNERKRRVFISRANAKYRRLLNEKQLMPELERLGFEIVRPEELSFADQVRIFSECAVVLAQHGAGLTNILFAPDRCRVLEIHGPDVTRPHYWIMACTLGHSYDCFVGQAVEASAKCVEPDFRVDLKQFFAWLNVALRHTE
jgi:capsular polysaccharide biosynthesis protein